MIILCIVCVYGNTTSEACDKLVILEITSYIIDLYKKCIKHIFMSFVLNSGVNPYAEIKIYKFVRRGNFYGKSVQGKSLFRTPDFDQFLSTQ
ncbi:uncharacterized protein OCT59_027562 [Rhizophagus irregularis]|uniref:uncharacterized protein n=1 Tax=Rhizophagus irregularis TaxID=588596 RepID=UPI0033282C91|nr:hypothetical protein OCT59_027562 [Rhizophagus irregularis]